MTLERQAPSDEFTVTPPAVPIETVAQWAHAEFGLEGLTEPLASERDQNVRIVTADGTFVVKVANRAELRSTLELQTAALQHLARVAPDLSVPGVVVTRTGAALAERDGQLVRCVTHLHGRAMAAIGGLPDATTLRGLGAFMGRVSAALAGFAHPAAHRPDFLWNLDAAQQRREWTASIDDPDARALVEAAFARHEQRAVPVLPTLRAAVVHHDANDHNVLVDDHGAVVGLIDFGDMLVARQVNELAVTMAYALMDQPDLVAAARPLIAGYVEQFALQPDELRVLFDLVVARLASSVAISAHRSAANADNEYLLVSQAPALRLLRRLMSMRPEFLHFVARDAAGLEPVPQHDALVAWMQSEACRPVSPLPFDLHTAPRLLVRLAEDSPGMEHAADPVAYEAWIEAQLAQLRGPGGADLPAVAFGAYDEDRSCYDGEQFVTDAPERRSVHLGIDLFVPAGTPVHAMLPGRVLTVVDNDAAYDYGPTVIVQHDAGDAGPFWCLYGHLARRTIEEIRPGTEVVAGDVVGWIGDHTVNGGWSPHVHLQLMTDLMADPVEGPSGNFEGAGEPSRMRVWRSIVPNVDLLLRLSPETFAPTTGPTPLVERRRRDLGASLSTSYRRPLSIIRGRGAHLIDHTGRAHLDCVNNVCHVGHAHPHVVTALTAQASVLNTNTRYLHPTVLDYAERLAATFPDPLEVVYFVNSGSEANELALRLARTVTGRHDVVAVDWAYHGNTNDLVEISPYKFNRRGGAGKPAHVHIADLPDTYRGAHRGDDAGDRYAESVAAAIGEADARTGRGPAAFIAESISGCGGQVVFPQGYLAGAYQYARAAGALCIADEVQVGFGRVGTSMWAFEHQGVVPDIVTLGKPMGNGHPLAAVVTTKAIADAFANGMEWFNTFGGNPVSCAVGMAVLDVIDDEQLIANAARVGRQLTEGFRDLQARHDVIGDVRGLGLYLGVDLVLDRATREPATAVAGDVINAMRDRGVLLSTDGPFDNILKIKPPLVFSDTDAVRLLTEFDLVLGSLSR